MIMNAKGGCGKTTLATNLACWFADQDGKVALLAAVTRDLALIKVAVTPETRPHVRQLCEVFRARIIAVRRTNGAGIGVAMPGSR